MKYTYFYKEQFQLGELSTWSEYDYVISMYSPNSRVIDPIGYIKAREVIWITDRLHCDDVFMSGGLKIVLDDLNKYRSIIDTLKDKNFNGKKVLVDSTGFFVPILLYLIRVLHSLNLYKFDVMYTEPDKYSDAEETIFTEDFIEVGAVYGMMGRNTSIMDNDLLIISAGYDHSRIVDVANDKRNAKKVLLFGFPSLSPIMFQENIMRAYRAEPALGSECFKDLDSNLYASASDPFAAAQIIHDYVDRQQFQMRDFKGGFTNIYMVPLATKPLALGMALYYMWERGWEKNISIIYPYCRRYNLDNSKGLSKVWRYEFVLPQ